MKKNLLIIGVLIANSVYAQIYTPTGNVGGATTNSATGNIGIGTNNPKSKLEVSGDVSFLDFVSAGSNSWKFHTPDDGRTSLLIAPKVGTDFDWTKQTEFVGNGNVNFSGNIYVVKNAGIGTITPQSKLTVHDNGAAGSTQLALTTAHSRNSDRYFMKNIIQGLGTDDVTFFLKHDGQMFVDGRMGVGTQTPQAKLDVRGDFRVQTGDNYLYYNGGADIQFRYLERGQGGRAIVHEGGNVLAFNYLNDFSGGTKIGTSLLVKGDNASLQGKLEAKEIKVTLTPTADFVFDEKYNLPKLEEVEKHIKENKHLPEIASAKEMEKEGVNVGEFQIKLLQKIEELTLYSIEQNKQLKKLQEDNVKLASEVKELKNKN